MTASFCFFIGPALLPFFGLPVLVTCGSTPLFAERLAFFDCLQLSSVFPHNDMVDAPMLGSFILLSSLPTIPDRPMRFPEPPFFTLYPAGPEKNNLLPTRSCLNGHGIFFRHYATGLRP